MVNKNPMCDGSHCRKVHGPVKLYPLGSGGNAILCESCWAHENQYRHERAEEYGQPDDWPQQNWYTAIEYSNG